MILALVGIEFSDRWWDSPNRAFENQTPTNVFLENPERVYSYLISHCDGQW